MATWRRILGVLRKSPEVGDPLPDGELLARFAASRDQAAFELLVWRHAAMVFGVCRRALRDEHLAEDAFQAAFLVLARKAGSVRGANVAGWLFRVARRVSVRAAKRLTTAQPIVVEPIATALPDRLERDELRTLLDDEIARLPERFRLPVLLCYLGGLSTEDAARQLGVPRGTILSRLSTARERLSARLSRRGVTVPAVAVAVATPNLVSTTVSAAGAFAARLPHLTTQSALVAEGVLRTMTLTKLVPVAAMFMLATGLVAGLVDGPRIAHATAEAQQPAKSAATPASPAPVETDKERERRERDVQLRTLELAARELRAQIAADEQNLRDAQRASALGDPLATARLDRQLALLETELFTTERDLAENRARRDILREKLVAAAFPIDEDRLAARVEQDEDVANIAGAVTLATQRLEAAKKVIKDTTTPTVVQLAQQVDEKKKALAAARAAAQSGWRKTMNAELRKALQARITEVEEKCEVTERVLATRKKLHNELEQQLIRRASHTTDWQSHVEALKPKKEMLQRLETRILEHQVGELPQVAAPAGVEAKLDVLIREVDALRKDVRDLKKR